jgi:ATP-binding cassette subfamily B protein
LRRTTAWVDPAVHLWNRSLVDNLRHGNDQVSAEQLGLVCRAAELMDLFAQLPEGLQTELGESGGLVSAGQGQRIRLGRALLHGAPRLVLLDEPFRGLDRDQRHLLSKRVRQHFQGSTMFLISHDVSDTLKFDRVLVIAGGRVVEDGTPSQLAADPQSLYRRLLDAEEFVRQAIWDSSRWRQLWLESGRLREVT